MNENDQIICGFSNNLHKQRTGTFLLILYPCAAALFLFVCFLLLQENITPVSFNF